MCPSHGETPGKHSPRFTDLVAKEQEVLPQEVAAVDGGDVSMDAGEGSSEARAGSGEPSRPSTAIPKRITGKREGASSTVAGRPSLWGSGDSPSSPRTPSRKREADGPEPPRDDNGEIIAGLPTLHKWPVEPDLLATTVVAATYDERTGELLDEEQVAQGRAKEDGQMETFNVKCDISYQEAKAKDLFRLGKSR